MSKDATIVEAMKPVSRRRVFFVPGYDPRRPAHYHAYLVKELASAARLRNYEAQAGALNETNCLAPSFAIVADVDGTRIDTVVSILRWDDLTGPTYTNSFIPRLPKLLGVGAGLLRDGVFGRVRAIDWRFAAFLAYPYIVAIAAALLVCALAVGVAVAVMAHAPGAGLPAALPEALAASLLAGLATAVTASWIMLRLERHVYLRYLLELWSYAIAHERGRCAELGRRLDAFAEVVADAAAEPGIDEVLLIGHSVGGFLAPEILARVLDRADHDGPRPSRLSLLTLGSMGPLMIIADPNAQFARALSRLAVEPNLAWFDVQSHHDVINVCPVDPIAVSGRFRERRPPWPRVLRLWMTDVAHPGEIGPWRGRFRFFHNHFRFLAANERTCWFDIFGAIVGSRALAAVLGSVEPIFPTSSPDPRARDAVATTVPQQTGVPRSTTTSVREKVPNKE